MMQLFVILKQVIMFYDGTFKPLVTLFVLTSVYLIEVCMSLLDLHE